MKLADWYFEWLRGTPFDLAVTVDANQYLAPGRRLGIFQAIDQRLNREFLGPRHSYLPESRRVRIVGVTEEKLSTVAFWLALAIPVDDTAPVKKTRAERALMVLFHSNERARILPSASIQVDVYRTDTWLQCICERINTHTGPYVRGFVRARDCG